MAKISFRSRLFLSIFVAVIIIGTFGFMVVEKLSLPDAFYFSIVTITTVGYGDIYPNTQLGKMLSIFLILAGVGSFLGLVGTIAEGLVERRVKDIMGLTSAPAKMKNHYIVCGYGKTGSVIVEELERLKQKFIVIDKNEEVARELSERKFPIIMGDALDEEVLKRTGVDRAKGLAVTFGEDADNIFVNITAKSLNPDIRVVTLATREDAIGKMYKTGADRVISPPIAGGRLMAKALITPFHLDFLDRVTLTKGLDVGYFAVKPGSPILGRSLQEIQDKTSATVIGISEEGNIYTQPSLQTCVKSGCTLIGIGNAEQLEKLHKIVAKETS